MSSDFLEMFLPNPVLSKLIEEDLRGFRVAGSEMFEVLRGSCMSGACPLEYERVRAGGSTSLPLVTEGEEALLGTFTGAAVSWLDFTETATPGRDLPAETGLSEGIVVLRFGGVSIGKSLGINGCCGGLGRGLGELGLDVGALL